MDFHDMATAHRQATDRERKEAVVAFLDRNIEQRREHKAAGAPMGKQLTNFELYQLAGTLR